MLVKQCARGGNKVGRNFHLGIGNVQRGVRAARVWPILRTGCVDFSSG